MLFLPHDPPKNCKRLDDGSALNSRKCPCVDDRLSPDLQSGPFSQTPASLVSGVAFPAIRRSIQGASFPAVEGDV